MESTVLPYKTGLYRLQIMDIDEIKYWSQKYINGELTQEEREKFETLYREIGVDTPTLPKGSVSKLREEIFQNVFVNNRRKFPGGFLLMAAAIAVLMISLILQVVFHKSDLVVKNIQKDIPPGSNRAMLILANGRQIDLAKAANGNLAMQGGLQIVKNGSGQLIYQNRHFEKQHEQPGDNTVSTPVGGTWQIVLPDGTKVWLNNSSSLTYPVTFEGEKRRKVELLGEAYFEVAKDKQHPFFVRSKNQEVTVLGTHFNIRAFKDDQLARTTLLEGKILVRRPGKPGSKVLKPGEQATFSNGIIKIDKVNIHDAIAWKDGYFRFANTPVEQVMRELSRWYGIEVRYDGPVPVENLNGKISRIKNISKVLVALEATKTVHFKVEGRRVTVMN